MRAETPLETAHRAPAHLADDAGLELRLELLEQLAPGLIHPGGIRRALLTCVEAQALSSGSSGPLEDPVRRICIPLVCCALLPPLLSASPIRALVNQAPNGTRLRPASARLNEEFSRIVGLRELSDGRVLIADADDGRLVVADFESNLVRKIGREGSGPGEYARPALLTSLSPDSTLMPDPVSRRWLVLQSDRIVLTIPVEHPAIKASRGWVKGTDEHGHALVTGPPPIREGIRTLGKADSIEMLLVTIATGRTDTITRLRTAPLEIWTELDNAGKVTRAGLRNPPFSVGEEPVIFPDGWVAIARLDPYRVEWRSPDGRWVRGAALPFREQPVDARERQAYLDRRATTFGRAQTPPPDNSWPATVPPFQPSPFVTAPDGTLLILRTPTADHPGHRYDRVDRVGNLVGWLELAATERLAGIGVRGAYVVATDENGIQHLQRHPWP